MLATACVRSPASTYSSARLLHQARCSSRVNAFPGVSDAGECRQWPEVAEIWPLRHGVATDVGVACPFAQMTIDAALKGPPFRREEALRRERWRATDLRLARKNRTLAGNSKHGDGGAVTSSRRKELKPWSPGGHLPPVLRQARTRTGAVPGPGLRHLDRLAMAVPEMPRGRLGRMVGTSRAVLRRPPNRAPLLTSARRFWLSGPRIGWFRAF